MYLSELDSEISSLEEEIKDKDQKEKLLWLKKQYRGSDEIISTKIYQRLIKKEQVPYKVYSEIPSLDKIIEGFRPGTLSIVSGPTKQGKTTFCQTLTYNFYKEKFRSLWFSFDTPPIELIERFPRDKSPIFYLPRRNFIEKKITWIEAKIIEAIAKYDIKIVFVDHLESLARYSNNAPNYAAELQSLVRELKDMAMRWNIIIFVNHHIRQISEGQSPNWTHLKNSTGPAQEADITMMVWRELMRGDFGDSIYSDVGNLSVQLHRRTGKTGLIKIIHRDNLFYELDTSYNESRF